MKRPGDFSGKRMNDWRWRKYRNYPSWCLPENPGAGILPGPAPARAREIGIAARGCTTLPGRGTGTGAGPGGEWHDARLMKTDGTPGIAR